MAETHLLSCYRSEEDQDRITTALKHGDSTWCSLLLINQDFPSLATSLLYHVYARPYSSLTVDPQDKSTQVLAPKDVLDDLSVSILKEVRFLGPIVAQYYSWLNIFQSITTEARRSQSAQNRHKRSACGKTSRALWSDDGMFAYLISSLHAFRVWLNLDSFIQAEEETTANPPKRGRAKKVHASLISIT